MKSEQSHILFTKNDSQALKGIAIILMVFHHCFFKKSRFVGFGVSFFPFSEDLVVQAALLSKICVSIFAFISGYGLYLSRKSSALSSGKWIFIQYVKTFFGYWVVWVICAGTSQLLSGRLIENFFSNGKWDGLINVIIDFLGLSNLFSAHTLLDTWWYMSAAFIFIVLTPFFVKRNDDLIWFLLMEIIFLRFIHGTNGEGVFTGVNSAYPFLTPFLFGMLFAKYRLFDKMGGFLTKKKRFFIEVLLMLVCFRAYGGINIAYYWELAWGLIPLVFILFFTEFVIPLPIVKECLVFLGFHSLNIYLLHNFLRQIYLTYFVYAWKHFLIIVFALLLMSVMLSYVVEGVKKLIHARKIMLGICSKIEGI